MAVLTNDSGDFLKLVGRYEHPLLEYWQDTYADAVKNSMIPILFDEIQSDNPTEAISQMVGSIDFKKWNGEFTYTGAKEGNTKVWVPIIWQAGQAYDRFFLSDAKLVNLKTDHGKFALAAARLREEAAAAIFTYANQTSFTVNGETLNWTLAANGLPLASTAHTSANYSATQGNLGTDTLSESSLENAIQAMVNFRDEDGNYANLQPDTLVVPFASRKKALELIGSDGKPDTADNNPNIYNGSMKLYVWKQFRKQSTKTNQPWFIMDSKAAKLSLKWINRLETGDDYDLISWKDEETQTWKVGSVMRFSAGAYDWKPFYFNIPA